MARHAPESRREPYRVGRAIRHPAGPDAGLRLDSAKKVRAPAANHRTIAKRSTKQCAALSSRHTLNTTGSLPDLRYCRTWLCIRGQRATSPHCVTRHVVVAATWRRLSRINRRRNRTADRPATCGSHSVAPTVGKLAQASAGPSPEAGDHACPTARYQTKDARARSRRDHKRARHRRRVTD